MDDAEKLSLEAIGRFVAAREEVRFEAENRLQFYGWVERVLVGQGYAEQGKESRGLVRGYMEKMTGLSRAQVTRLIARYTAGGRVQATVYRRRRFAELYPRADIELLASVDEAHETLSGPATRRILERVKISRRAFWRTIGLLFPMGAALDFFFARSFFEFPNPGATLRIAAPALGGGVPVEEYVFYFTGFVAVLLTYIWLDEYWLAAYSVPADAKMRSQFDRLLRFHPQSLVWAVVSIGAAIFYRWAFVKEPGFPGYFIFLAAGALGPSAALLPSAMPVINWRAFSLTMFIILLTSLLWDVTLAVPYGWWNFQDAAMVGIRIAAWSRLPIEEVCLWIAVTYATVIVYEIVRRWQASGKKIVRALLGLGLPFVPLRTR